MDAATGVRGEVSRATRGDFDASNCAALVLVHHEKEYGRALHRFPRKFSNRGIAWNMVRSLALRHRAGWDYKLNAVARTTRWAMVSIGYVLAAALPGPAAVSVIPGFVGMSFLCYPNLAYRLANLFIEWPVTEGRVLSITKAASTNVIMYDFQSGGESFGGTAFLKQAEIGTAEYAPGQPIAIRFDPLNPRESKIDMRPL